MNNNNQAEGERGSRGRGRVVRRVLMRKLSGEQTAAGVHQREADERLDSRVRQPSAGREVEWSGKSAKLLLHNTN